MPQTLHVCFRAFSALLISLSAVSFVQAAELAPQRNLIRFQEPKTLSFDELVELTAQDPPPSQLQSKLDALLSTPFISNEAAFDGAKPRQPVEPGVGRVLRIAEWNINRLDKDSMLLALSDFSGYREKATENPKLGPASLRKALEEVRNLQGADVIVMDEIDDGVKRSDYHNVPREIAQMLHMNYAFGVEFIELNPIYLNLKKMDTPDLSSQRRASEEHGVDPGRNTALEGTAIFSRYPILSVRIVHLPQEYDWYHSEIGAISALGKFEKWSAEKLFQERLTRQVRRGGRIMLVVELAIPGVPSGKLTVLCPHLEDYTTPKGRREQMTSILKQIGGIEGPVLSAGDLNTIGHNGAPATSKRSFWHFLTNYKLLAGGALYLVPPVPGIGYAGFVGNYVRNYHDPTSLNVPVLAESPEEPLFREIHEFRFDDGGQFDWAGAKEDSFGHKRRTLSDSNQRAFKGFATTFSFKRTWHGLIGEYKIDWMFVKVPQSAASKGNPRDWLAPRQGRALCHLNTAFERRISDHCPITVEFALRERPVP